MRKKVYARERKPTDGERGRQEQAARRETRVAERQKRNIGHTRPNRNRDKHGEGLFSLARDSICGARVAILQFFSIFAPDFHLPMKAARLRQ
ncbi:hypothetical protein JJE63_01370 [Alloprevotella tannerae]|nr:hypothetical protein [Alloprevotella tannerae]